MAMTAAAMPAYDSISMPELLTQLSREFDGMSRDIERLQETISELLATATVNPKVMEQAQALDAVFQHMAQLGAIVGRVAEQASPDWELPTRPILDNVSLSALAVRLSGAEHEAAESGEFEMF